MNDRMGSQHFATSADVERTRAELIERIEQTRADLIERMEQMRADLIDRMGQLEVRMVERIERTENRMLRWIAGLFVAQTLVLVGAVLGMIEVLR